MWKNRSSVRVCLIVDPINLYCKALEKHIACMCFPTQPFSRNGHQNMKQMHRIFSNLYEGDNYKVS